MVQLGHGSSLSQGQSVTCTSLPSSQCSLTSKLNSSSQISKEKFERVKCVLPESEESKKESQPLTGHFEYTLFVIAGVFYNWGKPHFRETL